MARRPDRDGGGNGPEERESASGRISARGVANEFAEGERARKGMAPEARRVLILGVIAAVFVFLAWVLPVHLVTYATTQLTASTFLDRMAGNLDALIGVFVGNGEAFEARFMIVVVCAVSGAAIGLCVSTYQGAFNNPLAAPKTLGVMAGGAAGALIYVVFLQDAGPQVPGGVTTQAQMSGWLATLNPLEWLWVEYGECLCSIIGCFLVVGVVMAVTAALGGGRMSNVVVIIFGTVMSTTVTALISFARYYYTSVVSVAGIDMVDQLREIENYTMIQSYSFRDLLIVVLPLLMCIIAILAMRRRLTLLSFGDDVAASMGINVNRSRYVMVALCTLMVAIAISFCGHVAFLGFISAHMARRIVGPDFRYLLPASVFVGAGFLTLVQYICQSGLPFTSPYAAGTVCSVLGALVFMGMVLAQRGKGGSGEWR